jgi:hypothetical protein
VLQEHDADQGQGHDDMNDNDDSCHNFINIEKNAMRCKPSIVFGFQLKMVRSAHPTPSFVFD